MIQRIQSIYLFIVTVLSVVICFYPYAEIGDRELTFWTSGIYQGLCIIIPLVTFGAIFMFRKRILQMRLCSFAAILMLFQAAFMLISYYMENCQNCHLCFVAIVPYINIILTYLAIRGIGKDEAMVRAADRLR